MDGFVQTLLSVGLTAGVIVAAVLLLRVLFQKAPRRWTVCLWALVAVRLLVPMLPSSPVGVVPHAHVEQVIETIVPSTPSAPKAPSTPAAPTSTDTTLVEAETKAPAWSVSQTLGCVWAIGAAAMLTYALVSTGRLKRCMRDATKWQDRVFQSEKVDSPFVLGLVRPRIYIPYGLSEEERDFVLAHERAHMRRGDHLIKPFGFLLLSVYWFQPLLWVAYICLCRDIEAACDEKVVAQMDDEARRRYSHTLVSLGVERRRIAACPVAFGEVGLKERVKRVMHYRKPTVWIVAIVLVLTAVASACLLTNRETPPSPQSTFEGAYVRVTSNGRSETMPVQVDAQATLDPMTFSVQKVDLEQMEVTVEFNTPLWSDGAKTTQVVLPYDADARDLRADAENGEVANYRLQIVMPTAVKTHSVGDLMLPDTWNTDYDTHQTEYIAEDMTLTLYPHYFTATFGRLADHTMNGAYEWTGDTLVLTEDGHLTEYVFRKGEGGALRYDAAASYRHPKAKSLDLSDGFVLSFSYRYEIERKKDERGVLWAEYAYRILDWDATVVAWEDALSSCPQIERVSDRLLRIMLVDTNAEQNAYRQVERFVDMQQKIPLSTYNQLVRDRDIDRVLTLYQPEAGGICYVEVQQYNGYTHGIGESYTNVQRFRLWGVRDFATADIRAELKGARLTVSYVDQQGKACAVAYDWQSGERIDD